MHLVNLEFKRIQTFLFAARQLRDMGGANVLLGETIRRDLVGLAQDKDLKRVDLGAHSDNVPGVISADPLALCPEKIDRDDPAALYADGVLARDGGHFRVVFEDEPSATTFRAAAEKMLAEKLPGLMVEIRIEDLEATFAERLRQAAAGEDARTTRPQKEPREIYPVDNPLFQVCEATGSGPGFVRDHGRKEWISKAIDQKREKYKKFSEGQPTHDVIGLMAATAGGQADPPEDFSALCAGDYMAVIHADGNDVGKKAKLVAGERMPTDFGAFVANEARMETFFQRNRAMFRIAIQRALADTFDPGGSVVPAFQLLMLGGDDLLMVCQAKQAMPFAVSFARHLAALEAGKPEDLNPEVGEMTFGMGIAIANPNVPFHHLHELAEALTASAKRLYRRLDRDEAVESTVDWHVETGSWAADPIGGRRHAQMVTTRIGEQVEHAVLSRRPLPILSKAEDADHRTLEGLLRAAEAITGHIDRDDDLRAARSQLRGVAHSLHHGRRWSDAAFAAMPVDLLELLATTPGIRLSRLWEGADGFWSTAFRDLVEIFEIGRLATARAGSSREDRDVE